MKGKEIRKTPLVHSPTFSQLIGLSLFEMEHQQKTGAFKIEAYYKIKSLSDDEKKNGVVADLLANYAQGVAFVHRLKIFHVQLLCQKLLHLQKWQQRKDMVLM